MTIEVLQPGLQTTLQAGIRAGYRHFGVPWSGPADPLSMALANRLVGKSPTETALEITLSGMKVRFQDKSGFAVTGGDAEVFLNGEKISLHKTCLALPGDILDIGPCVTGCRVYLALSGVISADAFLGSESTYIPGGFGGLSGRAVQEGDILRCAGHEVPEMLETPQHLRPFFNNQFLVQVVKGPDFDLLPEPDYLFDQTFKVTQRLSRMGAQLSGPDKMRTQNDGNLQSSAVFPGSVQCPPDGNPYILLSDCQTTGGYAHILQTIKSDRFQLGQLRPGASLKFVLRDKDDAVQRYRLRWEGYLSWLAEPCV